VNDLKWTRAQSKDRHALEYDPKLDVQIYNAEARALRGDGTSALSDLGTGASPTSHCV